MTHQRRITLAIASTALAAAALFGAVGCVDHNPGGPPFGNGQGNGPGKGPGH